jgi:hypothetical protein
LVEFQSVSLLPTAIATPSHPGYKVHNVLIDITKREMPQQNLHIHPDNLRKDLNILTLEVTNPFVVLGVGVPFSL